MATKTFKNIFATVLIAQAVLLTIYVASRNNLFSNGGNLSQICAPVARQKESVPDQQSTDSAVVNSGTTTGNISGPPITKSKVFQPIEDKQAWLYSAFYDHVAAHNGKPLVRLFGLILKGTPMAVHCMFTSKEGSFTTSANYTPFPDAHSKTYLPSHVECPLPREEHPTHVSVSFQTKIRPTNRFEILYPGPRIRNFTVCYSVLHSGFKKATELIESIEMNQILGAEHFMVYNHSISLAVDQVLRSYQQDGLVTVLQWPIPTLDSWYFAQMTALNDCFYRNRNTSRFVVVVDTDEYFVFKNQSTFIELINSVSPHEVDTSEFTSSSATTTNGHNLTGCFMVRSSFFTNNWKPNWDSLPPLQFPFGKDEKKNVVKYKMLTLTQFWRQKIIYDFQVKSKYIARPELVHTCGIHFVWRFTSGNKCLHISEEVALLHHYRIPYTNNGLVMETGILKFKPSLYPRIMEQILRFPEVFKQKNSVGVL